MRSAWFRRPSGALYDAEAFSIVRDMATYLRLPMPRILAALRERFIFMMSMITVAADESGIENGRHVSMTSSSDTPSTRPTDEIHHGNKRGVSIRR